MHAHPSTLQPMQPLRCDYDHAYESMYDSSYGTYFVFYDEEEYEADNGYTIH